jgi:hypothetical protein
MTLKAPTPHEPDQRHTIDQQPRIIRGAEDQAAAYEAWLAQRQDIDAEQEEREWQMIKRSLQETRRELGQRLLFPE